ncbi:hypothetical protein [Phytoactinopolyspora halophila]|uniref:hypothetical protein n=1 Tax=Phytoactinopolyspora halophila TaxID=1981511 RepID=UPI001313F730|nr:hypothetical protein [Phytoactinopolyspora halophila]
MDSVMSWCAECRTDTVFDAVPGGEPDEYVCRGCDAAILAGDAPVIDTPLVFAAA